jgi:hypothetical protein
VSAVSFTPLHGSTRLAADGTAVDTLYTSTSASAVIVAVDVISSSTTLTDSVDIAVGDVITRLVAQVREPTSFVRTRGTFLRQLVAFADADIAQVAAINTTAAAHGLILLNATETASLQRADNSLFSNVSVGVVVGVVFAILGGIALMGAVIFGMWRCSLRCAAKSGGWSGRDRRRRSDKGADDGVDAAGANGDANPGMGRRMSRVGSSMGDRRPSMGARRQSLGGRRDSMGGRRDSMGGRRASGMGARAPSAPGGALAPVPAASPSSGGPARLEGSGSRDGSTSGQMETRRISIVPRKSIHGGDAAAAADGAARVGSAAGRRGSRGDMAADGGDDGVAPAPMGRKWSGYGGRTDWMTPSMRSGSAAAGGDPAAPGSGATVPRLGSVTTSGATGARRRPSVSGPGGAGVAVPGALVLGDDVTQVDDPEGGLTGRPESAADGGMGASRASMHASPAGATTRSLAPVVGPTGRRGSGSGIGAKGEGEGRSPSPATLQGSSVTRGRADGVRAALLQAALPAGVTAGSGSSGTGRDAHDGGGGATGVLSPTSADAAVASLFPEA